MSDDAFSIPDMDDMMRQMQDAMDEAQDALEDMPEMLSGLGEVMGSLSGLMDDLPSDLGDLTEAMGSFSERHAANAEALVGEPDWTLKADIRVGDVLHVAVQAALDLDKVVETWESTQRGDFDDIVSGVVAENVEDLEPGMMDQILGQLKQGRGMARVEDVDVLECAIAGAPANAADLLQLSPEANIPLVMTEGGLSLEFAPILTIRNTWEYADVPTFSPMASDILVPLDHFLSGDPFSLTFTPSGQTEDVHLTLHFQPLI